MPGGAKASLHYLGHGGVGGHSRCPPGGGAPIQAARAGVAAPFCLKAFSSLAFRGLCTRTPE